ncbi:MAG: hypothetical protein KCHDKBKB_03128 [Elusimicrobia bacterium]|nr:hypothetical protein [Elusimicrobiota bacterium]
MLVGCHQMNVEEIMSRLRIGMTKAEMKDALKGEKFLKEQTVKAYPNSTEQETRATVWNHRHYEFVYPEDLILKKVPFDGSIKVYSYLVKEEKNFAVPVIIDSLAVFYDQGNDQVIGWAHLSTSGEVRIWRDEF